MSFQGIPFFGMNKVAAGGGGLPPFPSFDTSYIFAVGVNDGGGDTYRKVSTAGSLQWEDAPFGSGVRSSSIDISPYNNVYISGYTGGTYQFIKTDMDGNFTWGKSIGNTSLCVGIAYTSTTNEDYDVWVGGVTNSTNGFRIKYDSDGNQLELIEDSDINWGIMSDSNNYTYVVSNNTNGSKSIIKYDTDNTTELWSYNHGGYFSNVAVANDADYVCAGGSRVSNVTWRKFLSDGTLSYSRDCNGPMGPIGRHIFVDDINGYIYTVNESTPNLRKYSEDGTLLWSYSMSCSLCRAYGVVPDYAGAFIYTSQQQEGIKKWTDANPPVQQWRYDAGADFSIQTIVIYPLPYGRNQTAWV